MCVLPSSDCLFRVTPTENGVFDRLGVKNTIEGRGKGGSFHVKKNKGQSLIPRLLTLLYKGKRKERKIYKKKEVQIPKHLNTCVLVLPGDN